jgi:hypothetical protein
MDCPLRYLPDHKVIVCISCSYCIQSNGIELHFQRLHKLVPLKIRKQWVQHVKETMDIEHVLKPDEVIIPVRTSGPVPELQLVHGFECRQCEHVCGKLVSAELHGRTHGWAFGKEQTWKSQQVQVQSCY